MDQIDLALREHFGIDQFRAGQKEIIQAFLSGQDVVALMPTGAGKSLCYQLPALLAPGLMIVVSPLIALMDDQFQEWKALKSHCVCERWHSHLDSHRRRKILELIQADQLKVLLVSAEGLQNKELYELLVQKNILGIVIDEAHCLYHWGRSFRPAYTELGGLFQHTPIMFLSATLRYEEYCWVKKLFHIEKTFFWVSSMRRSNLKLKLKLTHDQHQKLEQILLQKKDQSGIIYAKTRREVDYLANKYGLYAYHAGMSQEQRKEVHRRFKSERAVKVVATMAFGMGVNRGDIRFVIHYGLAYSLSHYAQEAGRAGRDGLDSEAILLLNWRDFFWRRLNKDFIELMMFALLGPLRSWYLARLFEHRLRWTSWLRYF